MEVNNIIVARYISTDVVSLSKFFFDGIQKGFGLEDGKHSVKIKGLTCIPALTYNLGFHYPSKFSHEYFRDDHGNLIAAKDRITPEQKALFHVEHEMIQVLNVPGYDFILWHFGNFASDTDGCYLVGSVPGKRGSEDMILNSRKKYMEIYPIIWRSITEANKTGKFVTVTYKEGLK